MASISVLYSAPLVGSSPAETNTPNTLPILNWQREIDKVKSAVNDSRKNISVSRDVCTVDNFRKTLTLGTKILHYIGHGAANYIPFENGRGGVHAVRLALKKNHTRMHTSRNANFVAFCFLGP